MEKERINVGLKASQATSPFSGRLLRRERPLIIAGPCGAENENQIRETARAVAQNPMVKIFRAGVWKPRTRPGAFEGAGEPALRWLRDAKAETGLALAVEVAAPTHVEACLKAGVDVVWIGARTTVSPFAVQELAEALRGADVAVLIKNPINPDVALWLGALERVEKAAPREIGAVHRGFSLYERGKYRYPPQWDVPIEFMRRRPEVVMLCDPSHIAGKRALIAEIAQQALDLQMTGLMIETHISPESALSDAAQQLLPADLNELLAGLVLRNLSFDDAQTEAGVERLRRALDRIDAHLLELVAERMSVAEEIGRLKKAHNVTPLQLDRWEEVRNDRLQYGEELGLNSVFLEIFLAALHQTSLERQNQLLASPVSSEGT